MAIAPDHGEHDHLEPVEADFGIRQGQRAFNDGFAQGRIDGIVLLEKGDEAAADGGQPFLFFLIVNSDGAGQRRIAAGAADIAGEAVEPGKGGSDVVTAETGRRKLLASTAGSGQASGR